MTSDFQEKIGRAWDNLPEYLSQHVQISMIALAAGFAISLPVAILASRSRLLRWPVLTAASIIQTIPSIALLALFYPVLLGVAYITEDVLGWFSFSALGFFPTVIALTLYSMLPIIRNTVTGILGVDATVKEAARGIGMTSFQSLVKVELPLAAPVIIAGMRTATVWVVGIATLSTPVGQTSLGNYIFTGLQTENWIAVLFGCISAAVLALLLDQLIGVGESAAASRSKWRAAVAVVGILVVTAGGLSPALLRREPDFVVGAKTFTEQFILAELIQDSLEEAGLDAATREGLGSSIAFTALSNGDIDCYVDYSGTIWANYMKRNETKSPDTVMKEVTSWLESEHSIQSLGALGFENAYALAMRKDRAEELDIESLSDLAAHSADMKIGGSYEFFGRPEWSRIQKTYGLRFSERKQYEATFMYRAVQNGDVDVIAAFTSDGRIIEYDLRVLEDPRNGIPPFDALLLLSSEAAEDEQVTEALQPLLGKLTIDLMREANLRVDIHEESPKQAAAYLERQLGLADGD